LFRRPKFTPRGRKKFTTLRFHPYVLILKWLHVKKLFNNVSTINKNNQNLGRNAVAFLSQTNVGIIPQLSHAALFYILFNLLFTNDPLIQRYSLSY
jgi:hypothetical protein